MKNSTEILSVGFRALLRACSLDIQVTDIFLEIIVLLLQNQPIITTISRPRLFDHWKRDRGSPGYENYKLVMLKRSKSHT